MLASSDSEPSPVLWAVLPQARVTPSCKLRSHWEKSAPPPLSLNSVLLGFGKAVELLLPF